MTDRPMKNALPPEDGQGCHLRMSDDSSDAGVQQRGLLTLAQAADYLNLSPRYLQRLTHQNSVPSLKIGKLVRFAPCELTGWVLSNAPTTPGAADRIRQSVRRSLKK